MADVISQVATGPLSAQSTKAQPRDMPKRVGLLQLIVLSFFIASAGPFGIEEAISAGGALATVIFIIIAPIFISIPLALMSAELSTLFPFCGGPIDWTADMGHFVSSCNGYCRLMYTLLDNPLYAVSVIDYLGPLFGIPNHWWIRLISSFLVYGTVTILNCFGIEAVNWFSILLSIVILTPFFIFFGAAAPQIRASKVFNARPLSEINWVNLISASIWLYSGYDCVGSLANDVRNPRRVYPIGLIITVIIVTAVYLFPTVAGLSLDMTDDQWENGAFVVAARLLSIDKNGWLSTWIALGGAVSNLAILNVVHLCSAMEVYAMAENNMLGAKKYLMKQYTTKKGEQIPRISIIVLAIACFPLGIFDFSILISVNGLMTALSLIFQTTGFLYARYGRNGIIRRMQKAPTVNPYMSRETIDTIATATQMGAVTTGLSDIFNTDTKTAKDASSSTVDTPPNTAHPYNQSRSQEDAETIAHAPQPNAMHILDETMREIAGASKDDNLPWVVNHAKSLHVSADNDLYRIPGGLPVALLIAIPTYLVCGFIIVISGWKASLITIAFIAGCFAIKWISIGIQRCIEKNRRKNSSEEISLDKSHQLPVFRVEGSFAQNDQDEKSGFSHIPALISNSIPIIKQPVPSILSRTTRPARPDEPG